MTCLRKAFPPIICRARDTDYCQWPARRGTLSTLARGPGVTVWAAARPADDAAFEFLELADVCHARGEAQVVQELGGAGSRRGDQHPACRRHGCCCHHHHHNLCRRRAATTPARHGYLQQDLQRDLDAITATGVPGVLAEVRAGGRQLRGTSGVANLDSRKPVSPNGFFRIGSNTKTFISVVVLQLVAEHRLSLDDTVGHWLPGVVHGNGNDGTKITVRELLQHTSGLHNYTDDLQAQITSLEAYSKLEFHQFSRQDLLDIALAHQPDFAPGAGWNYSNTNYILLGMIIEKVTHHSWANEVTRRIIAPLGLHHTYAPGTAPPAGAARHRLPVLQPDHPGRHDRREHVLGQLGRRADQHRRRPDPVLERDRTRHAAAPGAAAGDAPTVPPTAVTPPACRALGTGWASSSSR